MAYRGSDSKVLGEDELIVATYDPAQRFNDDMTALWRQVGEVVSGQARHDARFDRLEGDISVLKTDVAVLKTDGAVLKADVSVLKTDVAELKTDVAVLKTDVGILKTDVGILKTDVAELKTDVGILKTDVGILKTDLAETRGQLGRLERATERGFSRVDAQLERLITLVQRDETKRR